MKDLRILVLSVSLVVLLTACTPEDNFTGTEYMPDMGHSLALEANTYNYYYYNTWDNESTVELSKLVYPRTVPEGTVPRGYASNFLPGAKAPLSLEAMSAMRGTFTATDDLNAIATPTSGHVPYYYDDSAEGRLAAIAELTENPFPITDEGLDRAKFLYETFCGICHGNSGNGLGYIYNEDENPNAKYPLAPANFLTDDLKSASNGRYYHAIYYGYNAMGAYKDKLSYEERWQVIHYIRNLQAKDAKLEYNQASNTLNPAHGMPLADFEAMAGSHSDDESHMEAAGQMSEDMHEGADHGDDHGQMRKK